MDSSLQQNLSSRDIKTLLFQPVTVGDEQSYLVYLAPEGENDGHFEQEEGGVVWYSAIYPDGEPCKTQLIPKALGDIILDGANQGFEQKVGKIERS